LLASVVTQQFYAIFSYRRITATMKSMNRQFGKLMKKGPGDKATVGVLLKDYDDADKMLAKVCFDLAH